MRGRDQGPETPRRPGFCALSAGLRQHRSSGQCRDDVVRAERIVEARDYLDTRSRPWGVLLPAASPPYHARPQGAESPRFFGGQVSISRRRGFQATCGWLWEGGDERRGAIRVSLHSRTSWPWAKLFDKIWPASSTSLSQRAVHPHRVPRPAGITGRDGPEWGCRRPS